MTTLQALREMWESAMARVSHPLKPSKQIWLCDSQARKRFEREFIKSAPEIFAHIQRLEAVKDAAQKMLASVEEHATGAFASQDDLFGALAALDAAAKGEK